MTAKNSEVTWSFWKPKLVYNPTYEKKIWLIFLILEKNEK